MPALIISSKICGILEVSNVTGGALSFFLLPDDVKIAYDGEAIQQLCIVSTKSGDEYHDFERQQEANSHPIQNPKPYMSVFPL